MRPRGGFTIIEVLVSLLILSLILAGLFMVLAAGDISFSVDAGMLQIEQQARQGMDQMVRELRHAQDPVITAINQDSDRLTFNTESEAGISYYRDINTNQLVRELPAGTAKILANNIAYFKCSFTSPVLEISLRADNTVRQKALTFSLGEKVRLRNE